MRFPAASTLRMKRTQVHPVPAVAVVVEGAGSTRPVFCAGCGAQSDGVAHFCSHCGHTVGPPAAVSPLPVVVGAVVVAPPTAVVGSVAPADTLPANPTGGSRVRVENSINGMPCSSCASCIGGAMCCILILGILAMIASSGGDECEGMFGPESPYANATEYEQCVRYRDMDDDRRRRAGGSFAGGAGAIYYAKNRGSSSSSSSGGGSCFVPGSLVLTDTYDVVQIEDVALGDVLAGGGRVTAILQLDGRADDL